MATPSDEVRALLAELRRGLQDGPERPATRRLRHAIALLEAAADAIDEMHALEHPAPLPAWVGPLAGRAPNA